MLKIGWAVHSGPVCQRCIVGSPLVPLGAVRQHHLVMAFQAAYLLHAVDRADGGHIENPKVLRAHSEKPDVWDTTHMALNPKP